MNLSSLKKRAAIIFIIAGISTLSCLANQPRREKWNILLISVDTLRADYLSCYGGEKVATPNIDKMANDGVIFLRAMAQTPLTLPSHTSMLTGTLPIYHGVRDNGIFRLKERHTTIAEILKEKGYHTGAFVGAFPLDSRFGLDQGFDVYDDYYQTSSGFRGFGFAERRAEVVIEAATGWLNKVKGKPWFCFIHLYDPHAPYLPPEPYISEYKGDLYGGEVAYTDYALGKLFSFLEKEGYSDNLVVIITSDHGESLGDHGEKTHGTFAYNSTIHIPLIIWQPRIFPRGRVIKRRVQHIDIVPSLLELLSMPINSEVQGRSFIPLIEHPEQGEDEVCYFEAMSAYFNRNWAPLSGIIAGHYKYIELPLPEVYDLRNDFLEKDNLANKNPVILRHLKKKLAPYITSYGSPEGITTTPLSIDEETRTRLKALGYIVGSPSQTRKTEFTPADDPKKLIPLSNELDTGMNLFLDGKADKAISIFKVLTEKAPTFTPAYLNLAYIHHEVGDIDRAITVLKEAEKKVVPTSTLLANLGLYLQEKGELEESLLVLKKALEKNPDDLDALNYLGITYFYAGKREEALATFEKLLNIDETFGSAHTNLGTIYLAEEKLSSAISEFEKAIRYSESPTAYNGLGVASYRLGRIDPAISAFKKAIELDPRQFDTLYNLGIILLKHGRGKEAIPYLKRFLATAPSYRYGKELDEVRKILGNLESTSF